jgi:phosphatidylcholine synthase
VLDLVVDFVTYVFVPAAILLRSEIIPAPFGMLSGLMITVGSALYFADTAMKTEDWWFRGFPAVWNVIAFYIVIFTPPVLVSFTIIVLLTAAMFLPVIFVHPFRVRRWRPLTLAMLALTCAAALYALFGERLQASLPIKAVLGIGAVYFLALGLLRLLPEDGAESNPHA